MQLPLKRGDSCVTWRGNVPGATGRYREIPDGYHMAVGTGCAIAVSGMAMTDTNINIPCCHIIIMPVPGSGSDPDGAKA